VKAALPKRRSHKKKPAQSKPLPPPLEVPQASSGPQVQEQSGGLFGNLGNLLSGKTVEAEAGPEVETFSSPSESSSPGSHPEAGPLSAEAEQILSQIPESIGEADEAGGPADLSGCENSAGVVELGAEICDEATARAALAWIGDTLAAWRKREEYSKAGQQAGAAGPHVARLVNQAWAQFAPAFLSNLGNAYPGLIPAVVIIGGAFGPAVLADVRESRKAAHKPLVGPQAGARVQGPVAVAPAASGAEWRGVRD
jgi:hypothetical protein